MPNAQRRFADMLSSYEDAQKFSVSWTVEPMSTLKYALIRRMEEIEAIQQRRGVSGHGVEARQRLRFQRLCILPRAFGQEPWNRHVLGHSAVEVSLVLAPEQIVSSTLANQAA
jgi:hypothetical protein